MTNSVTATLTQEELIAELQRNIGVLQGDVSTLYKEKTTLINERDAAETRAGRLQQIIDSMRTERDYVGATDRYLIFKLAKQVKNLMHSDGDPATLDAIIAAAKEPK